MAERYRLAIVASHPIQHFVSFYRALAAHPRIELMVFYAAKIGTQRYFDDEMLTEIKWEMDLLSDYPSVFLGGADAIQTISFKSIDSPDLAAALDTFNPDAVIVYGYTQRNAWRAMLWARRRRQRVFMISDSELLQKRNRLLELPKAAVVRLAYSFVSAFLSVGDRNEEYYRRYGVEQRRIFRSPFTIDEQTFRRAAADRAGARQRLHERLGLPDDAFIALFVGKLSARKRGGDLLAAAERLRSQHPNFHAVFAGAGAELDSLRRAAEHSGAPVHFLGFCNLGTLPDLYVAADVLVHPSELDPHPLVCSEAACVGLPVILSDRIGAEGPTDIARLGENAIIYKVGDIEALSAAISALVANPALRDRMSRRALEIFAQLDLRRSVAGVLEALDAR